MSRHITLIKKSIKHTLFRIAGKCDHARNYMLLRYTHNDVPFIHFHCHDCQFDDRGHVYGDGIDGWDKWVNAKNYIEEPF